MALTLRKTLEYTFANLLDDAPEALLEAVRWRVSAPGTPLVAGDVDVVFIEGGRAEATTPDCWAALPRAVARRAAGRGARVARRPSKTRRRVGCRASRRTARAD